MCHIADPAAKYGKTFCKQHEMLLRKKAPLILAMIEMYRHRQVRDIPKEYPLVKKALQRAKAQEEKKKESLQLVANYLQSLSEELEDGLTVEKVFDRAEIIKYPERRDWIVFEVERHKGIEGSVYSPGKPMESFMTYWPRYAFHPKTNTFEDLGELRKPEVHIAYYSVAEDMSPHLFNFKFSPASGGKHLCTDGNGEYIAANFDEVLAFVETVVEGLSFDEYYDKLDSLDKETVKGVIEEMKEAYKEVAIEKAERAWEDYNKGKKE